MMPTRRFLLLMTAVLLSLSNAAGQTATFVITGSVLDSSGAIVAGAKITLLNQQTNQRREVAANPAGVYEFRALPNGLYTIQAEMPGFKKEEIRSLQLTVAQTIQLDIELELGQVTESVTVEASAAQIQAPSKINRKLLKTGGSSYHVDEG